MLANAPLVISSAWHNSELAHTKIAARTTTKPILEIFITPLLLSFFLKLR
jgi:hypothetical protein